MVRGMRWSVLFLVMVLALGAGSGAMGACTLPNLGSWSGSTWLGGVVAHADEPPAASADAVLGSTPGDSGSGTTSWPGWLEPRGISVAELVGQVPEQYLHGMILSYEVGIVVYESGVRSGNTAVVTTSIYPRVIPDDGQPSHRLTIFGCIGQPPALDHMGSIFPDSTMRVYRSDGTEITSQLVDFYQTHFMGTALPLAGSRETYRYPKFNYPRGQGDAAPEAVSIPSNSGCDFFVGGDEYPLRGVFTFALDPCLHASLVGVQQATFHSYIGPGDMGIFAPLMSQMMGRFGPRHERIALAIPPGANYFVLRFPPMPGDYYTDKGRGTFENANRPTGGTYRLVGDGDSLSADLTTSTAFPLRVAWRDQDQAPGTTYLPQLVHPDQLAPLEYLIPAGVTYDPCFTQGNCPTGMLDQIYDTSMTLQVFYLSVTSSSAAGEWVPLKMAGPAWVPGLVGTPEEPVAVSGPLAGGEGTPAHALAGLLGGYHMYLPFIARLLPLPPPGCTCGWFDGTGRMLTYVVPSR